MAIISCLPIKVNIAIFLFQAGSEIFRSVSKLMNQATPGEVREYKGSFRHFRDVRGKFSKFLEVLKEFFKAFSALLDHKITDGSRRYITIKILKVDGYVSCFAGMF